MNHIDTMKLALEALEETRNALAWFYDSYPQDVTKKGNELLPHVETVLTAIREALAEQSAQGCNYCNHALYSGTKCKNCGRVTEQAAIKRDLTPEQQAQGETK